MMVLKEGFFANSSVGVITPKIVSFCGWSGDQIENKSKTCRIESVKEDVSGRGDFGNLPHITFKTPVFSWSPLKLKELYIIKFNMEE